MIDLHRRSPELDGLRGVAILLVIGQHYVVQTLRPAAGGVLETLLLPGRLAWTGVDLFFILSGFLLGSVLLANRDAPAFFRTFYIRRACRILPLYLVVLAGAWLLNERLWYAPKPELLPYLTFTQNFRYAATATFGAVTLAVTWSLAIEEQFYLLLPAIIRNFKPARLWKALLFCILLAPLLRYVLFLTMGRPGWFASHMLLFTRLDTLMLGVLIAFLLARGIHIPNRVLYPVWLVLGAAMLFLAWKDGGRSPDLLIRIFCYDVFALFYGATLLVTLRGGLPFLRWKVLTYTGVISYALYLLHHPINVLMRRHKQFVTNWYDVAMTVAAFAVVYLLSALSWELFEKRFVQYGRRYRYDDDGEVPARAAAEA